MRAKGWATCLFAGYVDEERLIEVSRVNKHYGIVGWAGRILVNETQRPKLPVRRYPRQSKRTQMPAGPPTVAAVGSAHREADSPTQGDKLALVQFSHEVPSEPDVVSENVQE